MIDNMCLHFNDEVIKMKEQIEKQELDTVITINHAYLTYIYTYHNAQSIPK